MFILTSEILKKIATTMTTKLSVDTTNSLNEICPMYGINTPDIFHEFIANVLHECQEFTVFKENLNYSSVALLSKFGNRINSIDANRVGRNKEHKADQEAIANIIYGGTWGFKNLGNSNPGDGWKFIGSGPIQLTGKYNISQFANYYNKRFNTTISFDDIAMMLRTNLNLGVHSACWIFSISKNLIQEAIDDNMTTIIKKINGGLLGIKERMEYYEKAKIYIL